MFRNQFPKSLNLFLNFIKMKTFNSVLLRKLLIKGRSMQLILEELFRAKKRKYK